MEERGAPTDVSVTKVQNILQAEINNRLGSRQQLHEKIIALDGEIAGLREAQQKVERLLASR